LKSVSVIIPCFNEEKTIQLVLQSIYQQDFNRSDVEVIIADGNSSDNTVQKIQIFQAEHPDLEIHVVENLERNIPAGLNTAIKHAQGTYIIRLDAHSMPQSDYIRLCIEDLKAKLGENVGGVWELLPGKMGGWPGQSPLPLPPLWV